MSFNCTLPSQDTSLVKEAITIDKQAKQARMNVQWHGRSLTVKVHFFNDKFSDADANKEMDRVIDKLLILADIYKLGQVGEKTSSIKLTHDDVLTREFEKPAQGQTAKNPKSYPIKPIELLKQKLEKVKKRVSTSKFKPNENLEQANTRIGILENAIKGFEQIYKPEPKQESEVKSAPKDKAQPEASEKNNQAATSPVVTAPVVAAPAQA